MPRIETARLVLRAHEATDFEALAELWADPEVVAHIGGRPATRREAWMRLLSYRGCWAVLGYGYWAIEDRETGRYAGDTGFADFHRDMDVPIRSIPEAGWVLAPWAQGRGLALEALEATHRWLDAHQGSGRSVCLIDPGHARSIRLAEKVGYRDPVTVRLNGVETVLLARHRIAR